MLDVFIMVFVVCVARLTVCVCVLCRELRDDGLSFCSKAFVSLFGSGKVGAGVWEGGRGRGGGGETKNQNQKNQRVSLAFFPDYLVN